MDCAFARFSCRLRAVPFLLVSLILAAPGCSSSQHARSEDITAAVTSGRSADFHGFPARHLMVAEPNEPSTVTNGTTRTSSGSSSEMSVQVDWHWDWMHVGALVAASVNFFAAAATGQGGAALLIPIFTSMLRMSVAQAISCAVFVTFLGSIPSLWHALLMEHPYDLNQTLIDYRTMTILTPEMLLGIKAGVTLNKMCPDWFVSFLLIIVYTLSTMKQTQNMVKLRVQEGRLAEAIKQVEHDVADLQTVASAASILSELQSSLPQTDTAGTDQLEHDLDVRLIQEAQEEKRRHKLLQLENSIQQIAEMSQDMLEKEAYTLPPKALRQTPMTAIQSALSQQHWPAGGSPRARALARSRTFGTAGQHSQHGVSHQHTDFGTVIGQQHAQSARSSPAPVPAALQHGLQPQLAATRCLTAPGSVASHLVPQISNIQNLGPGEVQPDHGQHARSLRDQQQHNSPQHLPLTGLLSGLTEDQLLHLGQTLSSVSPQLRRPLSPGLNLSLRGLGLSAQSPRRPKIRVSSLPPIRGSYSPSPMISSSGVRGIRGSSFPSSLLRGLSFPNPSRTSGSSPGRGSSPRLSMPAVCETAEGDQRAGAEAEDSAVATGPSTPPIGTAGLSQSHVELSLNKVSRSSSACSSSSSGLDSDSIGSVVSPFHSAQLAPPTRQTVVTEHTHDDQNQPELEQDAQVTLESAPLERAVQATQRPARCFCSTWLSSSSCCCCLSPGHPESDRDAIQHKQQQEKIHNSLRSLLAAAHSWWCKQPHLLQAVIASNFVAYCLFCLAWGWLPRCHSGFYAVTAAYVSASAGLVAWLCWLHWPKTAMHTLIQTPAAELDSSRSMIDLEKGPKDSQPPAISVSGTVKLKTAEPADVLAREEEPTPPDSAAADLRVYDMFKDIEWTRTRLLYFQPLMLTIGVASGLLGASPNTLFLTPMLVTMGQHPQIAAATLKLALFLSMSSGSIGFLVNGQLNIPYGLAFGITNLIITPVGQLVMDIWIRKTGRSSLILVAGALRNLVALPLMFAFNVVPGILDLVHHHNTDFHVIFCH